MKSTITKEQMCTVHVRVSEYRSSTHHRKNSVIHTRRKLILTIWSAKMNPQWTKINYITFI